VLRVQGAHLESGQDAHYVAHEVAEELAATAQWLGLDGITVSSRGDLAADLTKAVDRF
jgi:uncharacterized protein YcaQ